MMLDSEKLRREYTQSGLSRKELNTNPFVQFEEWMAQAVKAQLILPNAMSLATTNNNEVSIRTVLLKSFDAQGFVFFTNHQSRKSQQMQANTSVALLFPWLALERQVKISGQVEKISEADSMAYFSSRPKDSQLGAWASKQSSTLPSRQTLLDAFESVKTEFGEGEVLLPEFWGGYRVVPHSIEFWQGRENRLHDRFVYKQQDDNWVINRLAP